MMKKMMLLRKCKSVKYLKLNNKFLNILFYFLFYFYIELYYMSNSIIQQPVTQNYIYQTLISILSNDKTILLNGITPDTEIFLRYKNKNFTILRDNGYKYCFVYNFDLNDFLNPSADSIKRAEVISHDQMSINFGTNLSYISGYQNLIINTYFFFRGSFRQVVKKPIFKAVTIGYLYNLPASETTYSQQYGTNGITLKDYMQSVIDALPTIVDQCPVDMNQVQDYYPQNYVTNYTYTDLQGNTTTKTASFTAIKYTHYNGSKKVLFFGTGLQEYIVN